MASASNSQVVELLQTEFPEIDRINIEETLEACGGDAAEAATILRDVLDEEEGDGASAAPSQPPSLLGALLDAVSHLAQLPREHQPAASRQAVLAVCAGLESSGVHLTKPVGLLLDGVVELSEITAGLDEADAEVVRQMFGLTYSGGVLPRGDITPAEREELTAASHSDSDALKADLAAKQSDLAKKMAGLELLAKAVRQQRQNAVDRADELEKGAAALHLREKKFGEDFAGPELVD